MAAGGLGEDDESGRLLEFVLAPDREGTAACLSRPDGERGSARVHRQLLREPQRELREVVATRDGARAYASSPAPRRRSSRGSSKKSRGRSSKETAPSPVTSVVLVEAIPAGC